MNPGEELDLIAFLIHRWGFETLITTLRLYCEAQRDARPDDGTHYGTWDLRAQGLQEVLASYTSLRRDEGR